MFTWHWWGCIHLHKLVALAPLLPPWSLLFLSVPPFIPVAFCSCLPLYCNSDKSRRVRYSINITNREEFSETFIKGEKTICDTTLLGIWHWHVLPRDMYFYGQAVWWVALALATAYWITTHKSHFLTICVCHSLRTCQIKFRLSSDYSGCCWDTNMATMATLCSVPVMKSKRHVCRFLQRLMGSFYWLQIFYYIYLMNVLKYT